MRISQNVKGDNAKSALSYFYLKMNGIGAIPHFGNCSLLGSGLGLGLVLALEGNFP